MTEELRKIFADRFFENEPMSGHTNFHVGGPAKWFVIAESEDEIIAAIRLAKENNIQYFILGGGSNLLVADQGFDGLVIKIGMRELKIEGRRVYAESGVLSVNLARQTASAGLKGFEWAASLPGTVGGAVRGNAGCFGGETKDHLVSARVLRDGEIIELQNRDFQFSYRHSEIKETDDVVLSAIFEFEKANPDLLKMKIADMLETRKETQPIHAGSAGCIFKNYEIKTDQEFERLRSLDMIPDEMLEKRSISAGWLIDQAGLKGTKQGDVQVSKVHGNFILNLGAATAADIRDLALMIKNSVQEKFDIHLTEEVQYLGFD